MEGSGDNTPFMSRTITPHEGVFANNSVTPETVTQTGDIYNTTIVSIKSTLNDITRTTTVIDSVYNNNTSIIQSTVTLQDSVTDNATILRTLTLQDVSLSIPVLCVFVLVMSIGTVGNLLVLMTYFRRIQKSSTNLFIFCLAIFDLINCCVALPFEMHDILNPYTNPFGIICRCYKFLLFSVDLSAGYIIVCISFDRYMRIARPHRGFVLPRAKMAVMLVSLVSVLLCSMALYVYGVQTVPIESHPNLTGYRCGINEQADQTIVPLLFYTLMLICISGGVVILIVVYTRLGIRVKKWNRGRKGAKFDRPSSLFTPGINWKDESSSRTETPDGQTDSPRLMEMFKFPPVLYEEPSEHEEEEEAESQDPSPATNMSERADFVRQISRSLDQVNVETQDKNESNPSETVNQNSPRLRNNNLPNTKAAPVHENGTRTLPLPRVSKLQIKPIYRNIRRKSSVIALIELKRRMKLSKTTVMFIIATITFIASRIPYICVIIAFIVHPDSIANLTAVSSYFYRIALHSYIISYAANPLIYSFMNPKFRQECKTLVIKSTQKVKCRSRSFDVRV